MCFLCGQSDMVNSFIMQLYQIFLLRFESTFVTEEKNLQNLNLISLHVILMSVHMNSFIMQL